ncbi:MerR family transcriptional regulator [Terrisporobacter mayombei]|uniref:HTH merR-type domain-containing protein n=1 Tax=Terrisporobacter mayombei TaxID=1541 RepID=A0ABY9PZ86_9FIRM|nr:MerR family transcriptional regulator [Terrisporobacter mayombei]MCC3866781.1 MerR family transcriptional regulator [Terrisporobacter mayombei]WMT81018.1 hypothetical protein TEMA_13500 [Terrisporobacter mayombei]
MLSIGEFSKICKVSTKTLRYYDEIGLIYPDKINCDNGYRYYSIDQLKKMLFIERLKSYDFSLKEIKDILQLEENQVEEHLSLVLKEKKKEIENKIYAFENTLNQIYNDIYSLSQGISVMSYFENIDIQLVECEPMCILSVRKMVTVSDCAQGYGQFFNLLYKIIATDNLTMIGSPMTIYHSKEYKIDGYDIEFAIPIKEFVRGSRDFDPGLCIKTVLNGSYSKITSIYVKQREWLEKENYELSNLPYDVYMNNPEQVTSPEELITEIYCPVKKK